MFRVSTLMMNERSLASMLDQQSKVFETQLQISTGKRILSPSDDPAGASRVLRLTGAIETVRQYQSNADRAEARLESEESTLGGASNLLQRVNELVIQGSNGILAQSDKAAIAVEVRQLLDELFGLANTRDSGGEYIFAGYQTGNVPFSRGAAGFTYNGDVGQRKLQISADRQVADGDNGYDLFMNVSTGSGAKRSMFDTLDQLATTLEGGGAVDPYITDVQLALESVITTRTSVGARLNTIDEQKQVNDGIELVMETHRSKEEDLDYAEAIARFERQQIALQAAQQTFVKVQGLSLFNFL